MNKKTVENIFREEGLKDMPEIDIGRISQTAVIPAPQKRASSRKKTFAAVALAIVLIIGVSMFFGVFFGTTETELTISVNPALTLIITPAGTVKAVELLNSDAEELFDEKEIKNKSVDAATDYIVEKLYSAGYLDGDNELIVTAKGKRAKKANMLCEKVNGKAKGWANKHGKK